MSYADEAAAVTGMSEDERRDKGLCCVPGCPLLGDMGEGTQGTRDWFCGVHRGAAYSEQAAITARIANRRRLYVLARRLTNSAAGQPIPDQVSAWLEKNGRADILAAFAGANARRLTCRNLGTVMLMVLDHECRAPQQRLDTDKPTPKADTWQSGFDLLQGL